MAKVELDVAEMVEETFEKHFGVTLDRLRELAEADKDGRCVVLEEPYTLYKNDGFYCNICQKRHERAQKIIIGEDVFANKEAALKAGDPV